MLEVVVACKIRPPSAEAFPETEAPTFRSVPRLSGIFPGRVEHSLRGEDPGSTRPDSISDRVGRSGRGRRGEGFARYSKAAVQAPPARRRRPMTARPPARARPRPER